MKINRIKYLLFFLALVGLFILVFQFVRFPFIPVKASEAIPSYTSILFKVAPEKTIDTALSQLNGMLYTEAILYDIERISNIVPIKKNGLLAGLMTNGGEHPSWLYVVPRDDKILEDLLDQKRSWTASSTKNIKVHSTKLEDGYEFSIAEFRNLWVFSSKALYVEQSILQLKSYSTNFRHDANFRKLDRFEDLNANFYFYINFEAISNQFENFIRLAKISELKNFAQWVKWIKLGFEKNPHDEDWNILGSLKGNTSFVSKLKPINLNNIENIAGLNTSLLVAMDAPLVGQFNPDFQQYFDPWAHGELAYILTPNANNKIKNREKIMALKCNDPKKAMKLLSDYQKHTANTFQEKYKSFIIRQLNTNDILKPLFGKRLNPIIDPYFLIIDDYVMFSNTQTALKDVVNYHEKGITISNNIPEVQESDQEKISLYLNFNLISQILSNYLKAPYRVEFLKYLEKQFPFKLAFLKLKQSGKNHHIVGNIIKNATTPNVNNNGQIKKTKTLWTTKLQGNLVSAPKLIYSTQKQSGYVLYQDQSLNLVALDINGKEHWRIPLKNKISSDITLTRFENNEVLLFNSQKYIYNVMLKDGSSSENFPIFIRTTLKGSIKLIRNSNLQHSILVPSSNNKLYGYDLTGRPMSPFNPLNLKGNLKTPISIFHSETDAFIIYINNNNKLNVINSKGEIIFNQIKLESPSKSQPIFISSNQGQYLLYLQNDGSLFRINTDQTIHKIMDRLGKNSQMMANPHMTDQLIILSDKHLRIIDINTKKIINDLKLPSPYSHIDANENYICLASQTKSELIVFNSQLEILDGWPKTGSKNFTLAKGPNNPTILIAECPTGLCAYSLANSQ